MRDSTKTAKESHEHEDKSNPKKDETDTMVDGKWLGVHVNISENACLKFFIIVSAKYVSERYFFTANLIILLEMALCEYSQKYMEKEKHME